MTAWTSSLPQTVPAPSRPGLRTLAGLAVAGQLAFVAAWLVAGALEPGYSHVQQTITELGARSAEHPWLGRAAFVVLGLSLAALAPAMHALLPQSRARLAAAAGFSVAGFSLVLAGLLPVDCPATVDAACERALRAGDAPWETYAHGWAGVLSRLALLVTPFAVAAALWPRPAGVLALGAGAIGLVLGVLGVAFWWSGAAFDSEVAGLAERVELLALQVWALLVAGGVLYETRPAPALPAPTPLPPSRLYASSWSGEGHAMVWPPVVGRRMPVRFQARRATRWLDDETWTFDDEAAFSRGWTQHRRRFCRMVEPGHVHVTSDDLPDGADVWLDEGGYRIAPYTMLLPVGPVRLPVRCRQSGRMEGDRLVETIRCSFLGLPVGVAELRVTPDER